VDDGTAIALLLAPKVPPATPPITAPGAQPIGIVTRHPITAPDDPPWTPPVVGFAGGPKVHAARAPPSAMVLMILIIVPPASMPRSRWPASMSEPWQR
jgi:hypothetical protein